MGYGKEQFKVIQIDLGRDGEIVEKGLPEAGCSGERPRRVRRTGTGLQIGCTHISDAAIRKVLEIYNAV